jgi:hypothetical protein
MRGWILKALICITLLTAPAWAQRGGGSGGHGGGGGHASGFHGSPGFGGGRGWNGAGFGWRGNGWRGFPYAYGRWAYRGYPWWGWNSGYGYGYPGWYGYGWYDTFDGDDSSDYSSGAYDGYGYPPPYNTGYGYPPPGGSSASYASQGEVQRIQNEVAQLRAQYAQRYSEPAHAATVLVYRDGHTETVENYAVADSTLWILNQSRARKVPLSELDLPATRRDNEQRGVDFELPSSP